MRILVVCGAGASSTFVAQRLRRAAQAAGREVAAVATTAQSLANDLESADVVLVGPHLESALESIRDEARPRAVLVVPLPADIFTDLDGRRTLALLDDALRAPGTADTPPTERRPA